MTEQPIKPLIIGVGNRYRHDDSVGLLIARRLRAQLSSEVAVIDHSGEGAALLEILNGNALVIMIDAACSKAAAGTIHRLNAHEQKIPAKVFNYSTHTLGIAEAIEMARVLNQLPERLVIYGIEGENFTPGEGLSPAVEQAAQQVETEILSLMQSTQFSKSALT